MFTVLKAESSGSRFSRSYFLQNLIPRLAEGHLVPVSSGGPPLDVHVLLPQGHQYWGSSIPVEDLICMFHLIK